MLILSKIIGLLVVPPGLITVLLIIIFRLSSKTNKTAKVLLIFTIAIMYFSSTIIGEYILVRSLEKMYQPVYENDISKKTLAAVLAGGVINNNLPKEGYYEVGNATLKRLYAGYKLYKENNLDICVSGACIFNEKISLASTMQEVLEDWNVNKGKIILEDKSRNTWENAVEVMKKAKELGYERIIVVTSATHMLRSVYCFEQKAGDFIEIKPYPIDYLYSYDVIDWLPNKGSFNNNMRALHEWVGIIWYKIRY